MSKLTTIARIVLGLIFVVFGLNGFFHFLPMPPMHGRPEQFFLGLYATGYFIPFLFGVQVVGGALLLTGAYVSLGVVILAPIIANIFLFHFFIDRSGLPLAIVVTLLELYLALFAKPYCTKIRALFC